MFTISASTQEVHGSNLAKEGVFLSEDFSTFVFYSLDIGWMLSCRLPMKSGGHPFSYGTGWSSAGIPVGINFLQEFFIIALFRLFVSFRGYFKFQKSIENMMRKI